MCVSKLSFPPVRTMHDRRRYCSALESAEATSNNARYKSLCVPHFKVFPPRVSWRIFVMAAPSYVYPRFRANFHLPQSSVRTLVIKLKVRYWRLLLAISILSRCWRRSIVVRTLVSAVELSLSSARLLVGWVTTLWLSRPLSVSQHCQLSHPSLGGG